MKNLLLLLFASICLVSCSSYKDAMHADSNIRKVELGMTKSEVINKMGKSYQRMGASKDANGNSIEILGYATYAKDAIYMLRFENGELIEFYKDLILPADKVVRESSLD